MMFFGDSRRFGSSAGRVVTYKTVLYHRPQVVDHPWVGISPDTGSPVVEVRRLCAGVWRFIGDDFHAAFDGGKLVASELTYGNISCTGRAASHGCANQPSDLCSICSASTFSLE